MNNCILILAALAIAFVGCGQGEPTSVPVTPYQSSEVSTMSQTAPLIETYRNGELVFTLSDWTHAFFGPKWTIEKRCEVARELGLQLDLVSIDDQKVVDGHPEVRNLCVLPDMGRKPDGSGTYDPFEIGFNDPQHTQRVAGAITGAIGHAAAHKIPFVIVFTGFRTDQDPTAQFNNLVTGFREVVHHAEQKGVVLVLEMLNDRVAAPMKGHPGYLGNGTDFTARIAREVGSPNFGLVFDIYHMKKMDEDLLAMIEQHGDLIRYVHVAGAFPLSEDKDAVQRAELSLPGQQINYPAVMARLRQVFGGPVSFEYIPTTSDPNLATENLRQAIQMCGGQSKTPPTGV